MTCRAPEIVLGFDLISFVEAGLFFIFEKAGRYDGSHGGVHPPRNLSRATPIAHTARGARRPGRMRHNPGLSAHARHRPGDRGLGPFAHRRMVGNHAQTGQPYGFPYPVTLAREEGTESAPPPLVAQPRRRAAL